MSEGSQEVPGHTPAPHDCLSITPSPFALPFIKHLNQKGTLKGAFRLGEQLENL